MATHSSHWGEKRYHSLDYELKKIYGQKLYKLSLNGGMTCPNRDGTLGHRGCIFCSVGGSGDFAGNAAVSIKEQLISQKEKISGKYNGNGYIAYFQAYTNTYAPISYLEHIFTEAMHDPEVKVLSIATRPDCLDAEILALLSRLNEQKPVWIELGLQTIHETSASFIRRGYPLSIFEDALNHLHAIRIQVIVHVILYLPGETIDDMLATISYLNHCKIQGIKLQLLHVLDNTDLASYYMRTSFHLPDMEEYFHTLALCLAHLNPDITIHRLTGDGPKSHLIAPLWTSNKRYVLNQLQKYLKEYNIWQGMDYLPD